MKGKILFVAKSEDSASSRYRALQFFELLRGAGYQPHYVAMAGGPLAYIRALRMAQSAQLVVVLRKTFPLPLLWLLRRCSSILVYDFDDAVFCSSDGTPSATRMSRFKRMLRVCDCVTAGNHFLARTAARFNSDVVVIPTCIKPNKYLVQVPKPQDSIDLVWIGSSSTRKYLEDAIPALARAAERIPGLRLKIVADFDLPQSVVPTMAVRWTAEGEANALVSSHLGIAPMRDDDWTRGKCALKVLQYMASGLPVVSSNAGVNAEVVVEGETGRLVESEDQWVEALVRFADDESLRHAAGEAGRRIVEEKYSIDVVFKRMLSVYGRLIAGRGQA